MKRVKRWRYYCEFCRKASGSGGHMAKHEKGCTANPDRECGMCREAGLEQQPMSELIAALGKDLIKLSAIRESAQGCPACIVAAIRQSGYQYPADGEDYGQWIDYDFKKEKAAFWQKVEEGRETARERGLAEMYAEFDRAVGKALEGFVGERR